MQMSLSNKAPGNMALLPETTSIELAIRKSGCDG